MTSDNGFRFKTLAEFLTPEDLDPTSAIVHHGSTEAFDPHAVRSLTHFGTRKAAMSRIAERLARDPDLEGGDVYAFTLRMDRPFHLSGDGDGMRHDVARLAVALGEQGAIDVATAWRIAETRDGDGLCKALTAGGYDGIRYVNGVEDVGSTSWIVLDGSQATHTGGVARCDRDDLLDLGWL